MEQPPAMTPQPKRIPDNTRGSRKIKWGWILVCLIPVTIVGYAVIEWIANVLHIADSPVIHFVSTVVFYIGFGGVIALPVGAIMLASGYSKHRDAQNPAPSAQL